MSRARNSRLSTYVCLSSLLAAVLTPSAVSAELPIQSTTSGQVQFDIRFAPRELRKPVPYELVRQTAVFRAHVNGKEVWALLDNRVTVSLIDEAFARSLGLPLTLSAAGPLTAPTGTLQRWRMPPIDIDIPGQLGTHAPVSAVDLSRLSAFGDRQISLVIGKEYFDNLVFVFIPTSSEFQIGPSGSMRVPTDAISIDLRNGRPQIETTIKGQPVLLTVDLGYSGDIALRQDAWDRLKMSDLPLTPQRSVDASGTVSNNFATMLGEVPLGSRQVNGVKVALTNGLPEDGDGLVGFGMLSRFSFAIDTKARRIWLLPPFDSE